MGHSYNMAIRANKNLSFERLPKVSSGTAFLKNKDEESFV